MFGLVYKPPQAAKAAQENNDAYRATLFAVFILLTIPFTQFGKSYWISVQGFAFWLLLFTVRKTLTPQQLVMFLAVCVLMMLSLVGNAYADTLFYAFVRIVRQVLALYIVVCAALTLPWRPKPYFFKYLLPAVIFAVSGLVILQFVSYEFFGVSHFFVPSQLFIQGFGTIADSTLQLAEIRGFVADVRASGTFSEPSYFGFVALSFNALIVRTVSSARVKGILLVVLFAALLCAKTASGILMFVVFNAFVFRKSLTAGQKLVAAFFILACFILSALVLNAGLFERLLNVTDPVKEPSGYVRLVLPLKHILLVFQERPFGVPLTEFSFLVNKHIENYGSLLSIGQPLTMGWRVVGTDNAFLNLFITFGLFGFAVIAIIPFLIRDGLSLMYLFLAAQFNGDLLSPDKAVIMAFVLGIYRATQQRPVAPSSTVQRASKNSILLPVYR
jgi:ABC-type multidrug transport system fused ATPase/permease subunit